ncbi:hypothetical protein [Novosphingobium sp. EMRT-2]|uniref:hypothetical protein n=1 Tax=Novosphingobium sp. EMRT-2 TaxID=2571749 RepID=UPI0010BCF8AB|nr:hypothetical protein [Novosphingobium sp. EMRT-2]QCI93257.1 hypothetical protein FA702_06610 [Novosphingobium sp. EMRT-2]
MNFTKVLLISSLLLLPCPALAASTYLSCEFQSNGGVWPVNITADEQSGKVTLFMPSSGHTETVPAAFGADKVVFRTGMMAYELSRTDLSITRVVSVINSTEQGRCKVQQPPKRAF